MQRIVWNATQQKATQRLHTYNVSLEVRQLVKGNRKMRAIWQHTHNTKNKTRCNELRNKLRRGLRDARNETFKAYVISLSADDHMKRHKRFKKRQVRIPPIRDKTVLWARSDHGKAQLFGIYLNHYFQPHKKKSSKMSNISSRSLSTIPTFKVGELQAEIKRLNKKKKHQVMT